MKLNFERYYKDVAKLDVTSENAEELHGRCPFHGDETTVSFSVNKKTGLWKCFGTCHEGGNVFQFHAKRFNKSLSECEKDINVAMGLYKTISNDVVSKSQELLLRSKRMLHFLTEKRGLILDTIKSFRLGCDAERIYIPVKDSDGYTVDIRKYLPDFLRKPKSIKMLGWSSGFGEMRLYPIENMKHKEI
ncbi:MAG: CHC2 zinc finger domain-containing protein, partial [Candidatus Bathyarchaeota archaeon]